MIRSPSGDIMGLGFVSRFFGIPRLSLVEAICLKLRASICRVYIKDCTTHPISQELT